MMSLFFTTSVRSKQSRPLVSRLAIMIALVVTGTAGGSLCADCLCGTAADGLAAERAGLEIEWLVQVPFDAARATLEHVVIGSDLVVVQTGDGNVVAIQSGTARPNAPLPGTLLWKHPIDGDAGPFQPAAIGPELVAVAHGDGIHAFDRTTGQVLWSRRFPHLADGGAAVAGDWVFTPFGNGKVMRLPTNPFRSPAAGAGSETAETPPAAGEAKKPAAKQPRKKSRSTARRVESLEPIVLEGGGPVAFQPQPFQQGVLWCTEDGTLVMLDPRSDLWQRHEFFLGLPAAGRPLVHDGAIFVATAEGDLARIESREDAAYALRLVWSVFLDTEPEAALFAAGERLIVPLRDDGLAAFSTTTGALLWKSRARGNVVAVAADRIWLVDPMAGLVSLDLETGEPRDRFCLGGFVFPVTNQTTDRLILAAPGGAIVSLKAK